MEKVKNDDSDNDPKFGKLFTSIPDANLNIVTAADDEYQSSNDIIPVNKDELFISVMSKLKRKYKRKKAKA